MELIYYFTESKWLFIALILVTWIVIYKIHYKDYEIISIEEFNKTNLDMHEVEYFEMDQEESHNYNLEDGYMAFM